MEISKLCSKCKSSKLLSEFHVDKTHRDGHSSRCKFCVKKFGSKQDLEYKRKNHAKWYQENRETQRPKEREYARTRRKEDPLFKFKSNLRTRLWKFFKKINKSKQTEALLGCDWNTAFNHIQSRFTEGMSWDNYGQWHVDHVIPLSSAKSGEELTNLCRYTNLQPLWLDDHLKKTSEDRWRF